MNLNLLSNFGEALQFRKIINFEKLKPNLSLGNILLHTCWCFFYCDDGFKKKVSICSTIQFGNVFENLV